MVFRKIMNDMKNIFEDSKKNDSHNKKIINNLINQGKLHNKNKQIKINKFNQNKHIIENNTNIFSRGDRKIQKMQDDSSSVLNGLKDDYERNLTAWSVAHKTFMEDYTTFMDKIKSCRTTCQSTYKGKAMEMNACKDGCSLRQPELMDAIDDATYIDGTEVKPLDCTNLENQCSGGKVDLKGAALSPTTEQQNGCTVCGGGSGGKPIIKHGQAMGGLVRTKNIKSCDDVDAAYNTGSGAGKTACFVGFNNPAIQSGGNKFKSEYAKLIAYNASLDSSAQALEKESNKIARAKNKIKTQLHRLNGMTIGDDDVVEPVVDSFVVRESMQTMEDLLLKYDKIQADIIKIRGKRNNNKTSEAQLEDVEFKIKSERMQLYIWSGLAILTMLLVIQKVKQ
jgi:hypothetical protein